MVSSMNGPMKDSGIEWIGEMPVDWEISSIKKLANISSGEFMSKEQYEENGDIDIIGSNGKIGTTSRYNNDSDVVTTGRVGTIGTCHLIKRAWISDNALIIKTNEKCLTNYMLFVIPNLQFNLMTSGTAQPLITATSLKKQYIPLPPISSQELITSYLHAKITEIDNTLAKTRESIEEYKKYKQSLITETVTKGLNPNVKMKDSGVEWIGEIPEHWDFVKIKTLLHEINERNDNENAVLLSLFTALGVAPRSEMEDKGNKAMTVIGYKNVKSGDLIVNKLLAWMGAIAFSAYEGVTSPDYDVYRFNKNANAIEEFYEWYFRFTNFKDDCYKYGRGIMMMRWRTYPSEFKMIQVVNPPLDEQKLIVEYLKNKVAEIDLLISKKIELLSQLESYKKSLIYEVVTGKKEV